MIRYVASMFAGGIILFLWMATIHSIVWGIGGADFVYREGTRIETLPWILISLLIWLSGGVVGGFVSALIARHPTNLPPRLLAVLVGGVMIYAAFAYLRLGPADLPPGVDPASFDGVQYSIKPTWYPFTVAVLVAAGVLAGSWLVGDQSEEDAADEPASG